MKPTILIVCLTLGFISISANTIAQDKKEETSIPLDHFYVDRMGVSPFRKILSKITFGFSTGYSSTSLQHDLAGFGITQNPDSLPVLFRDPDGSNVRYSNWVNRTLPSNQVLAPGGREYNSDTTELGFKSKGFSIPLRLTAHIDFKKFRIGGGYSWDFLFLGDFKPISYTDEIRPFKTEQPNFTMKRYFGSIAIPAYRYYEYLVVGELTIGGYKLGSAYPKSQIKKGIAVTLGVLFEREMSEYFRLFVRPSYELKSYKLLMPGSGTELKHRFNSFTVNVGATYRIPELRRCFEKTCRIQMNHAHGNREYRSRVHPIYKKQNPNYGENHPVLIKYKGKNKRKLNPY